MTAPTHTFGGSAMDRHLFDFMPDDGAAGAEGGAAPSPAEPAAAAPEPTGEAAPSSPAATDTAPPWTPDNPLFLDAVDTRASELVEAQLAARLAPLTQMLEQRTGGQQQPAPMPALDPFSDDFGTALDQRLGLMLQRVEQMVQGVAQPLAAQQEAAQAAEGEQRIQDMIADDISRNGDLPAKAQPLVRTLAEQMFPEVSARYGATGRAAEMAVQKAAAMVRDIVSEALTMGAEQTRNQLSTLAGAHGEPGTGQAGVVTTSAQPLSARELARKYSASALGR